MIEYGFGPVAGASSSRTHMGAARGAPNDFSDGDERRRQSQIDTAVAEEVTAP